MKGRGKIHDMNSFLRMKKHVRCVLECFGMGHHKVGKAIWDDDAITIHGTRKSKLGNYYLIGPVEETVLHALEQNGIDFQAGPRSGLFDGIHYVLVRVDQDACPQPKKKKVKA